MTREKFDLYTAQKEIIYENARSASAAKGVGQFFTAGNMQGGQRAVLYVIKTRSGVNVARVAQHGSELEIMLRRGSKYKVTGVEFFEAGDLWGEGRPPETAFYDDTWDEGDVREYPVVYRRLREDERRAIIYLEEEE